MSWANPRPSTPPSRLPAGTRQPSKKSSEVSWPCWPSLSSVAPRRNPARPSVSTMTSERPFEPASGSVFATTHTSPATWPFEMKVFEPSRTISPPSRTARVRIPCRSEPAEGSDIAIAPTSSPRAIGGSHRRFCSSVPCAST